MLQLAIMMLNVALAATSPAELNPRMARFQRFQQARGWLIVIWFVLASYLYINVAGVIGRIGDETAFVLAADTWGKDQSDRLFNGSLAASGDTGSSHIVNSWKMPTTPANCHSRDCQARFKFATGRAAGSAVDCAAFTGKDDQATEDAPVVLITQMSCEVCDTSRGTFDRLEQLVHHWQGPISVAMMAYGENNRIAVANITRWYTADASPAVRKHVAIHILSVLSPMLLYPINLMRNLAMFYACRAERGKTYHFHIDSDNVPSISAKRLANALQQNAHAVQRQMETVSARYPPQTAAFIVPPFAFSDAGYRTRQRFEEILHSEGLMEEVHAGNVEVKHQRHHPASYIGNMNLSAWFRANSSFEIKYVQDYEPYVVHEAPLKVAFPAQFVGRGFNKAASTFAMHAAGYRFFSLPGAWAVDEGTSATWQLRLPYLETTFANHLYTTANRTNLHERDKCTMSKAHQGVPLTAWGFNNKHHIAHDCWWLVYLDNVLQTRVYTALLNWVDWVKRVSAFVSPWLFWTTLCSWLVVLASLLGNWFIVWGAPFLCMIFGGNNTNVPFATEFLAVVCWPQVALALVWPIPPRDVLKNNYTGSAPKAKEKVTPTKKEALDLARPFRRKTREGEMPVDRLWLLSKVVVGLTTIVVWVVWKRVNFKHVPLGIAHEHVPLDPLFSR